MSRKLSILGAFALGTCMILPSAFAQQGNGPVREGLRRTGEAVADTTRAAARATGEAVRRTGEAARNTVGGTADAVRRATGREAYNNQNSTNSRSYENGQRQPYTSNYRGEDNNWQDANAPANPQPYNNGRAYLLRHDSQGREFICVCGRRVYFDTQNEPTSADANANWNQEQNDSQSQQEYQANRPVIEDNQANSAMTKEAAPAAPAAPAEGSGITSSDSQRSENRQQLESESDLELKESENFRESTQQLQDSSGVNPANSGSNE